MDSRLWDTVTEAIIGCLLSQLNELKRSEYCVLHFIKEPASAYLINADPNLRGCYSVEAALKFLQSRDLVFHFVKEPARDNLINTFPDCYPLEERRRVEELLRSQLKDSLEAVHSQNNEEHRRLDELLRSQVKEGIRRLDEFLGSCNGVCGFKDPPRDDLIDSPGNFKSTDAHTQKEDWVSQAILLITSCTTGTLYVLSSSNHGTAPPSIFGGFPSTTIYHAFVVSIMFAFSCAFSAMFLGKNPPAARALRFLAVICLSSAFLLLLPAAIFFNRLY